MTDSQQMIETLKRLLKAQGLTYAELAARVGLSEASVKRVFSARTFTLARLEDFCRVLEIDFFELARLARGRSVDVREMTEKQETALANDARLLGVFYLLLSDRTASEILASYEITRADLTRLLVRLDRLGLIDLLPRDRVRVKVPRLLRLHPGGPIHRVHGKRVVGDFVAAEFDRIGGYFGSNTVNCRKLPTRCCDASSSASVRNFSNWPNSTALSRRNDARRRASCWRCAHGRCRW